MSCWRICVSQWAPEETRETKTYSDSDGATLSTLLGWQTVWFTKVGTPVTTTNRENGEFGNDDGGTNSSGDFFGGLDSQTNVTF